jgi:hypothetical protein
MVTATPPIGIIATGHGLAVAAAVARVIAIAEQHPTPLPGRLAQDAACAPRQAREKSDAELAARRRQSITPEPAA